MTVTTVDDAATVPAARSAIRRPTILGAAILAVGVAVAVLVGIDGSPWWRLMRVLAVAGCTWLLFTVQLLATPRWQGRLAVLVGVPAFAIGVGFAPHLAKGGPLVVQGATVVLVAAALVLLAGGAALATRERGLVRRLATGAVVLVATVLVMFVVSPAVAATNAPRPSLGARPGDAGLAHEDVSLHTPDGVELAAWYVPSSNRAAVILLHGAGSTRSNVLDHAVVLADAGFGVLMVDARGHGESSGRAMDFGWHGDSDIAAAIRYLTTRADVDPTRIGAVGLSMGGEEALGASGANDLLRAVVAEGATARNAADEAWLSDEYGLRGSVQEMLEQVQDRVTDVLTSASVPISSRAAVEASDGTRYLLITAGDVPDEGYAAAAISAGDPERVETWTVEGAGHTGGLRTAPDEWTERVVAFLMAALLSDST
jgi:pimeloyl-ACP methyl ester carboxylesterase